MNPPIYRIGFWAGLTAFAATVGYDTVQLGQVYGLLSYPLDEKLVYTTSLCIVLPFVLVILCLHYSTPGPKRFWSHAALICATLYAVFVTANYVVQLGTVIPQTMKGRLEAVRLLQQTPHSMFWNLDAVGYIFMGGAAAAIIPLFKGTGPSKWVRRSLIAHACTTPLIAIVYFFPDY